MLLSKMKGDLAMKKNEMKEELAILLAPLTKAVSGMQNELADMKGEISEMKGEMASMNARLKKVELTQENEILPRLRTIEDCYLATYERYRESVDDYREMKQDISVLKAVVAEHSKKLQYVG